MLAVTIVTPAYRHLEKEAVRRFKKHTGLPVKVIRCKDKEGFMTKLELDRHCPRDRVIFFDVDLWLLRDMHPERWDSFGWSAVHDSAVFNPHAFPHTDCGSHGMNPLRYFNSGLMAFNLGLHHHRKVFQEARKMRKQVLAGRMPVPKDVTDQFYLNMAVQRLNVSQVMLPTKFNFYKNASDWGQLAFIPRCIIGLHAAGEPVRSKHHALKVQSEVFGHDTCPVWRDAAIHNQNSIFDLR